MSAKLLNVFVDENPDLQRQFGCMSSLFQMFDRRHLLTGRHSDGQIQHRSIPSATLESDSHTHMILEKNLNRSIAENQRISVESSRLSFTSSSDSSSFSSLECNRSIQQENFPFQRNLQPSITTRRDRSSSVENAPVKSSRQSIVFRDVVKDSIYRDNTGLSTKNTSVMEEKYMMKHVDSPRPVPASRLKDGSFVIDRNGKPRMSLDLDESPRLLATLKGPRRYFPESKYQRRSSLEAKEEGFFSITRESPRFSCDSNAKSASKLKELPRLSLDSRESSTRCSNFDLKRSSFLKDLERNHAEERISRAFTLEEDIAGEKHPCNVVAKLMGLEGMPNKSPVSHVGLKRSTSCKDFPFEDTKNAVCCLNSPRITPEAKQDKLSPSKRSIKQATTPPKLMSHSQLPVEAAPWRQQEKNYGLQVNSLGNVDTSVRQRQESIYHEIDKKLEELEFLQSNKDFRALKQILDAIQAKRFSETKKSQGKQPGLATEKQKPESEVSRRSVESPIVIMRSAKPLRKCSTTPAKSLEGPVELRKVHTCEPSDKKIVPTSNRAIKDKAPKCSPRSTMDNLHASRYKKSNNVDESRLQEQRTGRSQGYSSPRPPSDNNVCSSKTSSTLSPRLQQRKLELEKRSCATVSSIDKIQPRRQSKQSSESVSPRGKLRIKPKPLQQEDGSLTETSSERNSCLQGNENSKISEISLVSHVDTELNSADCFAKLKLNSSGKQNTGGMASVVESKKSLMIPREGGYSTKLEAITSEQPSPISVLDRSFYREDSPPSPSNEISCFFKDQEAAGVDRSILSIVKLKPDTYVNQSKQKSTDLMVQNLGQLCTLKENSPVGQQINKLCNTMDPDQRYISEILLASGIQFEDPKVYQSGCAINSDLFLFLERRRSDFSKPEPINEATSKPKIDTERLHRKLVFDTVDEILVQKLGLVEPGLYPRSLIPGSSNLLKELFSDINKLQADGVKVSNSSDDDSDNLKMILSRDVMHQSEEWSAFGGEVSGLALEIERLIFKDLVDEVISSESVVILQARPSRRRRQFFA